MGTGGSRSVLQPVFFVGIAAILHGLLFLIPVEGPAGRDNETSRGIRVRTYVEGPRAAAPAAFRAPQPVIDAVSPTVGAESAYSMAGSDAATAGTAVGGEPTGEGGPYGVGGGSQEPTAGGGGPGTQSEFGQYLAHLRSDDVQGWARRSAKASRQGWRGSSAGPQGWGTGTGAESGSGTNAGSGGRKGGGPRRTPGETILDPRVRMVVIQYPLDEGGRAEVGKGRNIENRLRPVPYPDLKVKQSRFTSGWWNVYIEVWTRDDGHVARTNVLRPETNGPLERVFVDQVKRELQHWSFDPVASEIHVDVRFYVE